MTVRPIKTLGRLAQGVTIPANTSRAGIKVLTPGTRLLIGIKVTGLCTVRILAKEFNIVGRNVVYRGEVVSGSGAATIYLQVQGKEDVAIDIATGGAPALLNFLSLKEDAARA